MKILFMFLQITEKKSNPLSCVRHIYSKQWRETKLTSHVLNQCKSPKRERH